MLGLVIAESIQRCVIKMLARGRRRMATVHQLLESWVPGYDECDSALQAKVLRWIVEDGIDRDKVTELELAGWLVILATSRHSRATVLSRVRRALAA